MRQPKTPNPDGCDEEKPPSTALCPGIEEIEGKDQGWNDGPIRVDQPRAALDQAQDPEKNANVEEEKNIRDPERMIQDELADPGCCCSWDGWVITSSIPWIHWTEDRTNVQRMKGKSKKMDDWMNRCRDRENLRQGRGFKSCPYRVPRSISSHRHHQTKNRSTDSESRLRSRGKS